ncbi:hypothetical protein [Lignipirellula cremea]|uniref:hypothetical protein n=1 Tax=Lignipirellula cremea TaxID=2528010 RepID=UPI0011A1A634|nr:hypothetical protein [Lignipirellula cremea]
MRDFGLQGGDPIQQDGIGQLPDGGQAGSEDFLLHRGDGGQAFGFELQLVGPLGPVQLGDGGDRRQRLGQDGGDGRIVEG